MNEEEVLIPSVATTPEEVKAQEDERRRMLEQELSDVRWILSDARGRRFIWRLFDYCGVYRTVMTGNSYTFHNAGKQDVGHFVMGEVSMADPMALVNMTREQINEQKTREAKLKKRMGGK